jgi:hypothetical protein
MENPSRPEKGRDGSTRIIERDEKKLLSIKTKKTLYIYKQVLHDS